MSLKNYLGSDFKNKTTEEIFYSDFKIFHTDEFDFGVAQISAMSREELDKVAEKLRPFLKEVLGEKRIDMVYVMLTDILEESSKVIFEIASRLKHVLCMSLNIYFCYLCQSLGSQNVKLCAGRRTEH